MFVVEVVRARGHPNIRAEHEGTLEITRDEDLTPRGDCIIGVSADKAARDLSPRLKGLLREGRPLLVVLAAGGFVDFLECSGSPELELSDPERIVVRRSGYIEPSTLCVRASKAARDIDRRLVASLRSGSPLLVLLASPAYSQV
ncbi:MAG: DUF371 domain-containing protein [Fervidicoccaceae archaeon]